MLETDRLAFRYPGANEAYEFSLVAPPGAVTAISGPSGSGKSTLLDLVAGFLAPVSGTLTLSGASLLGLPPEKRPVSLLLQSESLFEHLSAGANIALGLPRRARDADDRIASALAEVGLPGIGGQRAATLSGGQKQRVALARTLVRDRPVLLLDEPFSALDDEARVSVRALVNRLSVAQGWITLLVSHNVEDIAAIAGRHYRLSDHRLVEV